MNRKNNPHILENRYESICEVRFNRVERKNALTLDMYDRLAEVLNEVDQDTQTKVLVFTGEGDAFTSGNDLMDFMKSPPTDIDTPVFRFLKALANFSKPLIAGVNGVAIGIGTTMLLHCDLVYASSNAIFQLPFIKLGLVPEAGASLLLPQMLGHRRAAELLMLGNKFTAIEAKDSGIINDHVPSDQLNTCVMEKAKALAALPPAAMRQTKALLKRVNRETLEQTMMIEGEVFMKGLGSPENREAFLAFFEKRSPDFTQFS
jgi:enoyl-CoA hydratase/carnithine racemase